MAKLLARRLAILALLYAAQLSGAAADSTTHPLQASELLGLVAGNALPENVAAKSLLMDWPSAPTTTTARCLKQQAQTPKFYLRYLPPKYLSSEPRTRRRLKIYCNTSLRPGN